MVTGSATRELDTRAKTHTRSSMSLCLTLLELGHVRCYGKRSVRGYLFACEGLPDVVGGGLELVRAAARGGGGGGGGSGQDNRSEGSAAAATAAARSEFVASLGGEEGLAASVALLAGCMARGDGDGSSGGGSEGGIAASNAGAAVLTVGALLGASPLPLPLDARAKRMAACDPDQAPVLVSEWELRTPSLAASGLVAVLVHRRKSHERSYCVAQSDDEEVASGFRVEHDEQWWADRGDGVNTITRSHYNADLSVRLEKDSTVDAYADSDSEGPQGGGGGVGECLRELQLLNIKVYKYSDSWDTYQSDLDVVANVVNLKHLRRLFFGPASPSLSSSPAAGQAISLSCFADALFSILSSRPGSNNDALFEVIMNNENIEEGCAHLMSLEAKLFVWRARSERSLPKEGFEEGCMADDELEGGGGGGDDDDMVDETVKNMFWVKAGEKASTSEESEAKEEAEAEVAGCAGDTPAPALSTVECFPFPLTLARALIEDSTAATNGCEEPEAKRNRTDSPQTSDENDDGGGGLDDKDDDDDDDDDDAPSGLRVGCARLCASAGISVMSAAGLRLVEELLLPALMLRLVAQLPPPELQADSGGGGGDAPLEMGVGDVALAAGRFLGQRSDATLRLSPYAGEVLDAILRSGEGNAGGLGAMLEGLLRNAPPAHSAVLRARLASASFSAPLGTLGALPDAALVACLRHQDPSPLGLPLPSVGVLTLRESGSGGAATWGSPEEATVGGLALVAVLRQVHPNLVLGPCAAACLADLLRAFAAHAAAGASRATARRLSTEAGETVEVTVADVVRCGALPGELAKHGASEAKKAATKLAAGDQSAGLVMALPADLVAQLQERVCGPGVALGAGALAALGGMVEYVCTTALSA